MIDSATGVMIAAGVIIGISAKSLQRIVTSIIAAHTVGGGGGIMVSIIVGRDYVTVVNTLTGKGVGMMEANTEVTIITIVKIEWWNCSSAIACGIILCISILNVSLLIL